MLHAIYIYDFGVTIEMNYFGIIFAQNINLAFITQKSCLIPDMLQRQITQQQSVYIIN